MDKKRNLTVRRFSYRAFPQSFWLAGKAFHLYRDLPCPRSVLIFSSKNPLIDIIRLMILGFREILVDNSDKSSSNEDGITVRVTFTKKAMVIDVTPLAVLWYFQPFTLLGFD